MGLDSVQAGEIGDPQNYVFFLAGGRVSGNGVHQERTWVSVPDMWQVEFWLIMSPLWASILFIFKENEAASSLHSLYRSDEET